MSQLDDWVADLARELGLDPAVLDSALVLDVARDAAHGIARPAAPLTTYLIGVATGRRGAGADAVQQTAALAQRLIAARTGGRPTSRLVLRAVDVDEAARIRDARPGPDDRWATDYPFDGDQRAVTAFLAASEVGELRPFGHYRIDRLSDGRTVGGIGFRGPPDVDGVVEVGFGLAPSARGRGYAREALSALLDVAREHGVRTVVASTTPDNVPSQRTLLGAGLTLSGADEELLHYRCEL